MAKAKTMKGVAPAVKLVKCADCKKHKLINIPGHSVCTDLHVRMISRIDALNECIYFE